MSKTFKLQLGDYIDLHVMSDQEKGAIWDFLVKSGNEFYYESSSLDYFHEYIGLSPGGLLIKCTEYRGYFANNRTAELLFAMNSKHPRGDAIKAYEFAGDHIAAAFKDEFKRLLSEDSLDNYTFDQDKYEASKDRKHKLKERLSELENEIASIKAELYK